MSVVSVSEAVTLAARGIVCLFVYNTSRRRSMRTTRLAWSWSAIVLMSGVGAGCAVATRSTPDGLVDGASLAQTTPEERRQQRDSAYAQAVADEVGPRVTVMADFQYAASNREVDAQFHMYDDAYVLVGHLDGGGRLKILFPAQPGDDG